MRGLRSGCQLPTALFSKLATEEQGSTPGTLTEALADCARTHADRVAYTFLRDGEAEANRLTFAELHRRAIVLGARLTSLNAPGDRAILLYPQGLEFITAFFACLYAGVVAVPASVPNRRSGIEVLRRVAADSGAKWILATGTLLEQFRDDIVTDSTLGAISCLDTEALADSAPGLWTPPVIEPHEVAVLQYTSGSTGSPRGVALTHANLVDNHRQIEASFGHDENTVIVSWLPMFHDMGLANVLHPAWIGGRCVLMSPRSFLQNPIRWLRAISAYRASSSGGPDFAFDLCVRRISSEEREGLDLTSWRVAYNGSEPVRAITIERFSEAFGACGFRQQAFHPVYGLAEATLFVTGDEPDTLPLIQQFSLDALELGQAEPVAGTARKQALVSCGHPWLDTDIAIVNPDSREPCEVGGLGEIWIRGASIAAGYWGKEADTQATFGAMTTDGRGPFLRTGDLGFVDDGHLFVTGRLKDLIIIRGLNHYPQDIEASASASHPSLVPHGCAAFSVNGTEGELLVVVQEVQRGALRTLDAARVIGAIRGAVSDNHALHTHAVVLVRPSTLPRTSSGKIRHKACQRAFIEESLDSVAFWTAPKTRTGTMDTTPGGERQQASARADRLIEWLRQHAADSISAWAGDERQAVSPSLLRIFGKQGLLGMQIEPEHGGSGLGHFDSARVLEQLAAIDFNLSLLVGLNNYLGIQPIARHAGSRIKALLLPGLAHGEELAAFALVEPHSGPSSATLLTRAETSGPGAFRLFGTKYLHCVAQGASVINVFARHDEPAGISAFVVSDGSQGLRQVRDGLSVGIFGFTQDTIVLDGVRVGRENILGTLGSGMDIARESMVHARLAVAAACIGGMKRCAQLVNRHGPLYANVYGKRTPNPVTLSRLGSVTARVTALECLVHRIARAIDSGERVPPEGFAACRILGPELLLRSVDDLMQLGVNGSQAESDRLACLYRDAGLLRNFDGPPEAVAELTGGLVMEDAASLRRLVEKVFEAPEVARWIDRVVETVRVRMKTLSGTLARRPQRWGHTRVGELSTWLALVAAVDGSRRETPSAELEHAYAWAQSQLEYALSSVRSGTPSEMATVDASDVAAALATYASTIGEVDQDVPGSADARRAVASWAGYVAGGVATPISSPEKSHLERGQRPETPTLPSARPSRGDLESWITDWLAGRLQVPMSEVRLDRSFADHGLDSVAAIELAMELSTAFDCVLDESLLWRFPTIALLVEHLTRTAPAGETSTGTGAKQWHDPSSEPTFTGQGDAELDRNPPYGLTSSAERAIVGAAHQGQPAHSIFTSYDYSNFYYGAGDDPLNLLAPFEEWYREALTNGYYLYSEPLQTAPGVEIAVRNRKTGEVQELLNLASYNYLGISYRDEVKNAAIEATRKYGLGASGSPILSGTLEIHNELAQELARFKDKQAAILFPTGYSANVGFISAIMRAGDTIFCDQYAHASVVDGAILAKSRTLFFRHNNALDLERKLAGVRGKKLVVVEGVYSMDGDVCALPEILEVAKRHGARVLIDEAHSTFLFGPHGRGVAEHFGLDNEVDFHLGTLSKTLGGQGGFVCGSRDLIDYLNAFARSRAFSCNLAPPVAAGLLAGLRIVEREPELRVKLWSNVAYLRRRFAEERIDIGKSTSQVMPVLVNNDAKVFAVAERIQEGGLYLQPVTYPAVPKHKSRLRISISAAHSEEQLETAIQVIARALRREGISH